MPAVSFTDRSHGDTNTVHLIDINFEYNGEAKVSQYFEHKIKNSPEGMTNYVNGKFFIGKATELSDSNIHMMQRIHFSAPVKAPVFLPRRHGPVHRG